MTRATAKILMFVCVIGLPAISFAEDAVDPKQELEATKKAIRRLEEREQVAAVARAVSLKNAKNLKDSYVRALNDKLRAESAKMEMQTKAADARREADEAQKKAASVETVKPELEAKIAEAKKTTEEWEKKASSEEDRARELSKKADDLQGSIDDLTAKLEKSEEGVNGRDARIDALKDQVEALKRAQEASDKKNRELAALTVKEMTEDWRKKEAEYKSKIKDLDSQIGRYQKKNAEFARLVDSKNKANDKARRSVKTIRDSGRDVQALNREAAIAHYNLGVLYMKQSHNQEASQEFIRALELNPNDALAHYNLAVIDDAYLNLPEDAMKHYEAYLRLLPGAKDAKEVEYRLFQVKLRRDIGGNKM